MSDTPSSDSAELESGTSRDLLWWADRAASLIILAIIGGFASHTIGTYFDNRALGLFWASVPVVGYWWLTMARPIVVGGEPSA